MRHRVFSLLVSYRGDISNFHTSCLMRRWVIFNHKKFFDSIWEKGTRLHSMSWGRSQYTTTLFFNVICSRNFRFENVHYRGSVNFKKTQIICSKNSDLFSKRILLTNIFCMFGAHWDYYSFSLLKIDFWQKLLQYFSAPKLPFHCIRLPPPPPLVRLPITCCFR